MILTCPACKTSYSVKDGAIPPQGRTVRCAECKHSWHQDGVAAAPVEQAFPIQPEDAPETAPDAEQAAPAKAVEEEVEPGADVASSDAPVETAVVEAAVVEAGPEDAPPALTEAESPAPQADAYVDWNDSGYGGDDEPAPRRKGPLIIALLILFVAALAAAAWFLAPRAWMARAGLVAPSSDSPLKLMVISQDRQKLASGNDLVSLSGRVINPTDSTQPVPALQADLRDNGGKLVYSWTIAPPAERLGPRASAGFNAAELGVPANATSLTLRWAS